MDPHFDDPRHRHHIAGGRSRYEHVACPPPPHLQFPDALYYPSNPHHHPHHHPHLRLGPPSPAPPLPPHLRDFEEGRLFFPYPHPPDRAPLTPHPPPHPLSRVPDRPSLRHYPPNREESPPHEFWVGGDSSGSRKVDKAPDMARLEWEEGERPRLAHNYKACEPYVPEELGVSPPSWKRLRWAHDRDLKESSKWIDKRLPRVREGHRLPFELVPPPASSPRGFRNFSLPDRGREEASSIVELQPALSPPLWTSGHSRDAIDFHARNQRHVYDDGVDGIEPKYFANNRGEGKMPDRVMNHRGSFHFSTHRSAPKHSAQPRGSVWQRIQENPSFISSPSSLPKSPQFAKYNDEDQSEMGGLNLSYESDALDAKNLVSPNQILTGSTKKSPVMVVSNNKMMNKAKKMVMKRGKALVPNYSPLLTPRLKELAKASLTASPIKVPNYSEGSIKAVISSNKSAEVVASRSSLKRVKKVASIEKNMNVSIAETIECRNGVGMESNCKIDPENRILHDSGSELCEKDCAVAIYMENTAVDSFRSADNIANVDGRKASQENEIVTLCEKGDSAVVTSTEKIAVGSIRSAEKIVKGDGRKDYEEGEIVALGGEESIINRNEVSDVVVYNDAHLKPFSKEAVGKVTSLDISTRDGSSKAIGMFDSSIKGDLTYKSAYAMDDRGNSLCNAKSDAIESTGIYSPSVGFPEQEIVFLGPTTSSAGNRYLSCVKMESQGEEAKEEEKQESMIEIMNRDPEILDMGKNENDNSLLRSGLQSLSALSMETRDAVLDQHLFDDAMGNGDNCRLYTTTALPQSDCLTSSESNIVGFDRNAAILPSIESADPMPKALNILNPTGVEQPNSHVPCSNDYNVNDNSINQVAEPCKKDDKSYAEKARLFTSEEGNLQIVDDSKAVDGVKTTQKTSRNSQVFKALPAQISLPSALKKESSHLNHNARHRTWHRGSAFSSASASHWNPQNTGGNLVHKLSPKKLGKIQSSYFRKGNTLIRKSANGRSPTHSSRLVTAPNKPTKIEIKRSLKFERKGNGCDNGACPSGSFERPKTPPLPFNNKSVGQSSDPIETGSHNLGEPVEEEPIKPITSSSADNQGIKSLEKLEAGNLNRMVYVKHKSNQLIAAIKPKFVESAKEKTLTLPALAQADLYYKKKKNQIVLNASSSNCPSRKDTLLADNSNSDDNIDSRISSNSKVSDVLDKEPEDFQKRNKGRRSSNVWALSGQDPHRNRSKPFRNSKALPYFLPWKKRTILWRNPTSNRSSIWSSLWTVRKLLLARKRDAIYTVSKDGFSLRKTGVLSIGGSSLKWSRSIERCSKKANEEATLAVAEVERKKRERQKRLPIRNKRKRAELTLHASGGKPGKSCETSLNTRLLASSGGYVRASNGNQLVRNPKKLVQILASEKVRWSLHTARSRLSKKQQYCQFFTRFGHCNKKGGNCPYIHDPGKVAICTRFLRGLCENENCKLTHKVLPERMPDCSYFLLGLCTNTSCPYRHVNVNPNASVCEGFIRGYCVDGDECRKKHTYVCPVFEAKGECPEGSKCKLYHPRSRNQSKKRRAVTIQSTGRKRYFDCCIGGGVEPPSLSSDNIDSQNCSDLFYSGGQLADYIDLSSYDDVNVDDTQDLQQFQSDSDCSDLDALIKPIRIMKANQQDSSIHL